MNTEQRIAAIPDVGVVVLAERRQTVVVTWRLRDDHLAEPHPQRLPTTYPRRAAILAAHAAAIASGDPMYRDPATGLTVFTAQFLADRAYCCESGCRHCPYVA